MEIISHIGGDSEVLEQLEKINKIYDLMALCASYVINEYNKPDNKYEFATFDDAQFDCVYDAVELYTHNCQYQGHRAAFNELREFALSFLKDNLTVERVYAVVYYIDELVDIEINDNFLEGRHVIKYEALNEQYQDCIRIIPKKFKSFLDSGDAWYRTTKDSEYSMLRDRRECACSCFDGEMSNYSIWNKRLIEKYPLTIYRFDKKSMVAQRFCDRSKFNFGIVPFTDKALEQILDIRYRNRAFFIDKMHEESEEELLKRYDDICDRSQKSEVDFLIFPEMLLTNDIVSGRKSQAGRDAQIIINGSISQNRVNKTIVTDGNKNEIFRYCKKEPFTMEDKGKEYKEWLDSAQNKEYSIMEIEGIGRVGIAICKDLLSEDVRMLHKHVGTDVLIVPAYTSSSDLLSAAQNMSTDYNCVVVIANACSAIGSASLDKEIGFITLPMKCKGNRRGSRVIPYFRKDCAESCSAMCIGKKIEIDFNDTKEDEEGISYQVRESQF